MTTKKMSDELYLFKGLKSLSDNSFPKSCGNCGRNFETIEQYLKETNSLESSSGLKASFDDDEQPILEVYRNCICGSTLMDFFSDRRDLTERGRKRREIFQRVLKFLKQKGVSHDEGREAILAFMRSGESELLARFGINGKIYDV